MTNRGTLGPLRGWKILVPRGGTFGHDVAEAVRARGAFPITAPLINFASPAPDDSPRLMDALVRLERGEYDWLVVTSATAVDVMHSLQARVPESTRIAAAGETTATALLAGGFRVDFVPTHDNSAKGLLVEWRESGRRMPKINVLWLHSEHSKPSFANGLKRRGHNVDSVIVLITSGSVAEQVRKQFSPIPDELLLAAIGPRTAKDARALGLRIDVIARQRSVASLLDGMEWYVCGEPLAETSALDLRELMRLEREELEGEVPPEDVPAVDEERPETGIIKLPPNADR
jgi:uroporphyrinogen-III synthase